MAYATLAELKDLLEIPDAADDTLLTLALDSASDTIDRAYGRTFTLAATATLRTYRPSGRGRDLAVHDMGVAPTLITGNVGATTLLPVTGPPWTAIEAETGWTSPATVTARWGWPSVPVAVRHATLLQASRWFKRKEAPFGLAGSPDTGLVRLYARLDPDVEEMLRTYEAKWGVA